MTSNLTVFESKQFGTIRTVLRNNEPWFVANDIALALGYQKARNAIAQHVDKDDALKQGVIDNLGRQQKTTIINESGLYALIFGSKLETAKQFKHWVTSEVLPSIRKTGRYEAKPTDDYRTRNLAVKEMNARSRQAQTLVRLAQLTQNDTCREALIASAANTVSNTNLLPLPALPTRTYQAGEIGAMLGVSKQKIGRLSEQHGLKTAEYGSWFAEFVSPKGETQTFRYYENAIEVFRQLLAAEVA